MKSQSGSVNSREVCLFPRAQGPGEYIPSIRLVPDRIVKTQAFRANIEREALQVIGYEAAFLIYFVGGKAGPSL